jgi:hypothetical protein
MASARDLGHDRIVASVIRMAVTVGQHNVAKRPQPIDRLAQERTKRRGGTGVDDVERRTTPVQNRVSDSA